MINFIIIKNKKECHQFVKPLMWCDIFALNQQERERERERKRERKKKSNEQHSAEPIEILIIDILINLSLTLSFIITLVNVIKLPLLGWW